MYYDGRNNQLNPTRGVYDTLTLKIVPDCLTTYDGSRTFSQAEVDHRIFTSPVSGLVLAGRLALAGSWGRPSYQHRYSLGGPYALRGYYTNRFRGDSYYVLQGEARKKLFWIFSGALFAEAGAVTEDRFGGPEVSAGAGLRMTLPPDHIAKARLDFAWAEDQPLFTSCSGKRSDSPVKQAPLFS
ncbi:MAG: BamA/TamA family outer membrane protein [bacterium]|nr:BamA/TamA family outer membrane protein [bacterium]MDT8396284.1 BamA/TamA family outer membrane protein [bacterium]